MIKEVAFVGYPITDVARARAFYENALGLKLSEDHTLEGGKVWIEYDIAGVSLALSDTWQPSGQSGPSIAPEVEDIDQTLAGLISGGVPVYLQKIESPVCWLAVVGDPDGNALVIHQRKLSS
jgi:predicted enzyme related to lactoylglutathione lyase